MGGYPHEKDEMEWLDKNDPQLKRKDIREQIGALRQIKSPGEIAFLKQAIDLSDDAHLAAMKMMRPGLYEYQVAAKMVEVHAMGGSEAEGYSPIVGAGPNSTALHYDKTVSQDRRRRHRGARRRRAILRATRPTSRARFRPTENSRRGSAKSTKSCWARKTPRSPR